MYDVAMKVFKALLGKVRQAVQRNDVNIQTIGVKPMKTLDYIDVTPKSQKKKHRVIQRQTSERVTLPKPVVRSWHERDLKGVKIQWIRDPKDADNVTHLLIKPVFDDEDVA